MAGGQQLGAVEHPQPAHVEQSGCRRKEQPGHRPGVRRGQQGAPRAAGRQRAHGESEGPGEGKQQRRDHRDDHVLGRMSREGSPQ